MQMPLASSVEAETARIGQVLAQHSAGKVPAVFQSHWWTRTMVDWCLKDPHFKVQLFRFIDVLPSLSSHERVLHILGEYFGASDILSTPFRSALEAISRSRFGARIGGYALRRFVYHMAYTFIAGATVEEAFPVLSTMWTQKRSYSMDLLGEATLSEGEADSYRDRCLAALQFLGRHVQAWPPMEGSEHDHLGPLPRVQLSIKLSALYSQLDPIDPEGSYRAVAGRLRPILDVASGLPAGITFDMEQAELKTLTLKVFQRILSEPEYKTYPFGGIAVQAYLKETRQDLEALLQWVRRRGTPVTIRLVKGAYWDADSIRYQERGWPIPVFRDKGETDVNYEFLAGELVRHADIVRPAFATHNVRSLAHALALAEVAKLSPETCECQMIFGMAEPLQRAAVQFGRRVRIYTPVGRVLPGMAYLVRRLLENTSNESFLRQEYLHTKPLSELLAPPSNRPRRKNMKTGRAVFPDVRKEDRSLHAFKNEPHTDFSEDLPRATMFEALATARKEFGRQLDYPTPSGYHYDGDELVSRNPSAPGEVLGRIPTFSLEKVGYLVRHGVEAFDVWKRTTVKDRTTILRNAAQIMRNERFSLAAWEVFETGKPWREADADVAEAIDFLEYYSKQMERIGLPVQLGCEPGEMNRLSLHPRGPIVVISPWNFSLAIPTGLVSAGVVTGNVVLFKPSERSTIMGTHLVRIFQKAGLPEGVLQLIPGGPEVGEALVDHPDIHVIAFTGSKDVGLRILSKASIVSDGQRFVKRVIAEMGGKNAIVVDDTADLDEAVTGVVRSFSGYQGQKCSACSRAIVVDSIYDQFIDRLFEAVLSLKIGPPEDPSHTIGPMIDQRALDKVRYYIELGKKEGRLIVERTVKSMGYFAGPTVIGDIQVNDRLAQEEVFGPVLAVMRAKNFQEALLWANETSYALTGGLYSRSPAHIQEVMDSYMVGNLYINRPITGSLVGRQPFGGHRLSGVGAKAGGEEYLQQFMVSRVVSENTLRRGFAPTL